MSAAETHLDRESRRRAAANEKATFGVVFSLVQYDSMSARGLLFAQGLVLFSTAVIYLAGLEYFLFWKLWWFDILLHFLGGLWAALASAWFFALLSRRLNLFSIILCVLLIALGWEAFEYILGFPREEAYLFDVFLDITMGVLGGLVGALFARS